MTRPSPGPPGDTVPGATFPAFLRRPDIRTAAAAADHGGAIILGNMMQPRGGLMPCVSSAAAAAGGGWHFSPSRGCQ